jgi:hypothetical protein
MRTVILEITAEHKYNYKPTANTKKCSHKKKAYIMLLDGTFGRNLED